MSKYKPSALQGTLQLEASKPRAGLAREHPLERRIFSILLIALAVFIAGYLYFVTASILHVMATSEAMHEAGDIQSSISAMEGRYLALSQTISPNDAGSLGLAPVSHTSYVYRPGNEAARNVSQSAI
jgi:hypothetical protein